MEHNLLTSTATKRPKSRAKEKARRGLPPANMTEALRLAVIKLPMPVRMRATNALDGFDKARALLEIDREMASFRAITAEEEAAAALFVSLQRRKYPGAERLSLKDHRVKAALAPFIQAVKTSFGMRREMQLHITLDWSKPEIEIQIPLAELGVNFPGSENLVLKPVPPLDILSVHGNLHPSNFFDEGLAKVVEGAMQKDLARMISKEANVRNKLLYASDTALPESKATIEGIDYRQRRAEAVLLLCIGVLQTPKVQNLPKQALQAFLRCVGRDADDSFSYEKPAEEDFTINVGDPARVSVKPKAEALPAEKAPDVSV